MSRLKKSVEHVIQGSKSRMLVQTPQGRLASQRFFSTSDSREALSGVSKEKFSQKLWVLQQSDEALSSVLKGNVGDQADYKPSHALPSDRRRRFARILIQERAIQRRVVMSPTTPFSAYGMEPFSALVGLTQALISGETAPDLSKYYRCPLFVHRYEDMGWSLPEIAKLVAEITYGIQPSPGEGYRTSPTNIAVTPFLDIEVGKYNLGGDAMRVAADIWAESILHREVLQLVSDQLETGRTCSEVLQAVIKCTKKWESDASISGAKKMAVKIAKSIDKLGRSNFSHLELQSKVELICKNSRTYRILTGGDSLHQTDLYRLSRDFLIHQMRSDFPLMELISANGYKITSSVSLSELTQQLNIERPGKTVTILPTDDISALIEVYGNQARLAASTNVLCVLPAMRIVQHANEPHHVYRRSRELEEAITGDPTLRFLRQLIRLGEDPRELQAMYDHFRDVLDTAFSKAKVQREQNKHLISLPELIKVSNVGPTALTRSLGVVHTVTTDLAPASNPLGAQLENKTLLGHLAAGGHLVAQEHIGARSEESEGHGVYFTASKTGPYKGQVHYTNYTSEFDLALMDFALSRAGFLPIGLFPHDYFDMIAQLVLRLHSTESFDYGGMRTPVGSINVKPNGAGKTLYVHGTAQAPVEEPNQLVMHINFANQISATFKLARALAEKGAVVSIITNPDMYGEKLGKDGEIPTLSQDDIIRYPGSKPNPDLVIVTMATGVRAARTLQLAAMKNSSHSLSKVSIEVIELPCSGYPNALPRQLATLERTTLVVVYDPYCNFGGMGSRLAKLLSSKELSHLRFHSGAFPEIHDANNQIKNGESEYLLKMIQEQLSDDLFNSSQEQEHKMAISPIPLPNDAVAVQAVELNPGSKGTIQEILIGHNQIVKKGQIIARIETDKAVVEVIAPESGYLAHVIETGKEVDCETTLFFISDRPIESSNLPRATPAPAPKKMEASIESKDLSLRQQSQMVSLNMNQLQMRKNMEHSAKIPQATVQYMVKITNVISAIERANQNSASKLRLLPFVLKAMAMALSNSEMNYQVGKDLTTQVLLGEAVNLGIAVATKTGGLVVVKISNVQGKTPAEINNELNALVERAREGKSKPEDLDMTNVSTVISNMGDRDVNVVAATGQIYGEAPNMLILGSYQQAKPCPRPGRKSELEVSLPVAWTFDHRHRGGANTRGPMRDFQRHLLSILGIPSHTAQNQYNFWEKPKSSARPQEMAQGLQESEKVTESPISLGRA